MFNLLEAGARSWVITSFKLQKVISTSWRLKLEPSVKLLLNVCLGSGGWLHKFTHCGGRHSCLHAFMQQNWYLVPRKNVDIMGLLLGDRETQKHFWIYNFCLRSQDNLQITAVGCFKMSLLQAGLVFLEKVQHLLLVNSELRLSPFWY